MSLTEQLVRQRYNANGSTTTFAIPFVFYSDSTIVKVLVLETDGETETPQTSGVDYNVVGSNVVFVTAPATGKKVVIYQDIDLDQDQDYSDQSSFLPSSMETALDRLTSQIQQVDEKTGRSLLLPRSSNTTGLVIEEPVADTSLVWDPTGTRVIKGPSVSAIEGAQQAGLDAVAAAASASDSADDAAISATSAATSASAAATSASAAATSATNVAADAAAAAASAAAALSSENNAATSETNAATSETNAANSAAAAATSATNAANSATAAATSATNAATSETNAAASATAAAASAASVQGGYTVENSSGTPANVTAAGGVVLSDNTKHRIKKYVQGNGAAIDITVNPQITAGAYDGQELLLHGRSNTNTLQLDDGNGLVLQGPCILAADEMIKLNWDGTNWVEEFRSN